MSAEKPRIHWISPLPPAETDIAHYTYRILPELSAAADVTLWTDARNWDSDLESFCEVRRFSPAEMTPRAMKSAGQDRPATIFAQMGNSWVFHSGILALCLRLPTVLILHDVALQEMYLDAIQNGLLDRDTYLESMSYWYGSQGQNAAQETLAGDHGRMSLAERYPGFELAMSRATAVLTHTPAATEAVHARRFLPVYGLDLPFRAKPEWNSRRSDTGPLRFVQFGFTGPNRRLETVLEALSDMGSDFDFLLDIFGPIWDPDHIRQVCERLGLLTRVTLHGYVAEPILDHALANAHLVFNLRNPTMGEASGSQLRIWNAGTASVVTNHGWYESLPDDTVFRVSPNNEREDLVALLKTLQRDRHIGAERGARGRAILQTRHSSQRYVDGLLSVAARQEVDARDRCIADAGQAALAKMRPETRALARHRIAGWFESGA